MELADAVQGAWQAYEGLQQSSPLLGAMLTSQVVFPIGDVISQLITDREVRWKQVGYTTTTASLNGAALHGLMQSGELVGQYIADHPLAKAALGPNLTGNAFNLAFLIHNSIGEKHDYDLRAVGRHYRTLFRKEESLASSVDETPGEQTIQQEEPRKGLWQRAQEACSNFKENYFDYLPGRQYKNTVITTLTWWNAFQWANYALVPEAWRTQAVLSVTIPWVTILSLWSLVGRREVVSGMEAPVAPLTTATPDVAPEEVQDK